MPSLRMCMVSCSPTKTEHLSCKMICFRCRVVRGRLQTSARFTRAHAHVRCKVYTHAHACKIPDYTRVSACTIPGYTHAGAFFMLFLFVVLRSLEYFRAHVVLLCCHEASTYNLGLDFCTVILIHVLSYDSVRLIRDSL